MKKSFKKILKQNRFPFLYAITCEMTNEADLIERIKKLNNLGVNVFQIRQKQMNDIDFIKLASRIKSCLHNESILIINDNLNVAKSSGADGIHIGQDDINIIQCKKVLPDNQLIGVSVHTLQQAILAQEQGADYIGVGSMFKTNTKEDANMVDMNILIEIRQKIKIPIIVIGGININNFEKFKHNNIDGIAMISAFFNNDNYENDLLSMMVNLSKW